MTECAVDLFEAIQIQLDESDTAAAVLEALTSARSKVRVNSSRFGSPVRHRRRLVGVASGLLVLLAGGKPSQPGEHGDENQAYSDGQQRGPAGDCLDMQQPASGLDGCLPAGFCL